MVDVWELPDANAVQSTLDITAYDLRHIETDAPDKADANFPPLGGAGRLVRCPRHAVRRFLPF